MNSRTYLAFYDDGHDLGDFEFSSSYRKGSKGNFKDAMDTFKRKYGQKRSSEIEITEIYLQD